MLDSIGYFIAGVIYLAIIYMLVRPGSDGPALIKLVGNGLDAVVKTATASTSQGQSS